MSGLGEGAGERLRRLRKRRGLSVVQVAERARKSPSAVRAHENGQNGVNVEVAEVYARVLRANPEWILYGSGDEPDEAPGIVEHMANTPSLPQADPRLSYVPVEVLPTYAGMGGGGTGEGDAMVALLPRSLVEDELKAKPTDLLVINVRGDSMEPLFHHGDQIVIDRRDTRPTQPGPFALLYSDGYVVKNVEVLRAKGKLRIFSTNPIYTDDEEDPEAVTIMGRPVWFARRL